MHGTTFNYLDYFHSVQTSNESETSSVLIEFFLHLFSNYGALMQLRHIVKKKKFMKSKTAQFKLIR